MKKHQVPQDSGSLSKQNIQEVCYAIDENGHYTQVASSGWEVKTLVLNESLALIKERVEEAKKAMEEGRLSPIPYHMERCRMDIALLSAYVGLHRWFVKRHFKPAVFRKLKDRTLSRYAAAFGISVDILKSSQPVHDP